jgi:hypothetical protein
MPKKWLLGNGSRTYVIARRGDLFPPEVSTLYPSVITDNLDAWLTDSGARQTLIDVCETVGVPAGRAPGGDLKRRVVEAFRQGDLVVLNTRRGDVFRRMEKADEAAPPPPQDEPPSRPAKTLTWIEIELMNDKGEPVPKERYRIELPDGSPEEGFLDSQGRARVDGIEAGTCNVTFPDIDANEWRAA